jgi:hypothetical protein
LCRVYAFRAVKVGFPAPRVKPPGCLDSFAFPDISSYIQPVAKRILFLAGLTVLTLAGAICSAQDTPAPVVRGLFTYHFDQPRYVPLADSTLRLTRTRLQKLIQNPLDFPADIYLVNTRREFDSLIGGKFPDWGAAVAIPVWQRIVVKSPDHFQLGRPLGELLRHEYSHLALAERTGLHEAPRWFNEGLAMIVSMEWSWNNNLTMSLAAVFGDFIPLHEIERMNRFSESRARLAYVESYMAVQYMFDLYGIDAVNVFLDEVARGASMDDALMASVGSDYAGFEKELHEYWQSRFNLITLVTSSMYFWLGLAIILIIGAILALKRRKDYYKKWEEEEKYASTDFDYGDPDHPEQVDDDEPWRH